MHYFRDQLPQKTPEAQARTGDLFAAHHSETALLVKRQVLCVCNAHTKLHKKIYTIPNPDKPELKSKSNVLCIFFLIVQEFNWLGTKLVEAWITPENSLNG